MFIRLPYHVPNWSCYAEWLRLATFEYSHPIVGGKVAQPPRAIHTAMPRTTIIPVSYADVFKTSTT